MLLAKAFTDSLGLYENLVVHFGDFKGIFRLVERGPWFKTSTWLAIFPPLLCQFWLLFRIYQVSRKNWWATASLSLLVIAATVASILASAARSKFFSDSYSFLLKICFPLFAYTTLVTDILLTATFIGFVLRLQPEVIHPGFRSVLGRMILVSVQGCLPSTLATIGMTIAYELRKETLAFIPFQILLAPLYVISVLTTLLSRSPPDSPTNQTQHSREALSIEVRSALQSKRTRMEAIEGFEPDET
ncbi:hypothetical protein T439DRAFT_327692 [Meredithblackwellia eburnea MCA 4105]